MEIERKFIIPELTQEIMNKFKTLPNTLSSETELYSSYISIIPEIRIRKRKMLGNTDFKMTLKSEAVTEGMSREEIDNIELDKSKYDALIRVFAPQEPIKKSPHFKVVLPNKHVIEISIVDAGTPTSFIYAEVEFKTEEAAAKFKLPKYLSSFNEVTSDPYYKMKNYWQRTRLNQITNSEV